MRTQMSALVTMMLPAALGGIIAACLALLGGVSAHTLPIAVVVGIGLGGAAGSALWHRVRSKEHT